MNKRILNFKCQVKYLQKYRLFTLDYEYFKENLIFLEKVK
jgi:hypothetical protein